MWVRAGRTEQVDAPGRFFIRELLGERIIATWNGGRERVLQRVPASRDRAVQRGRKVFFPEASSAHTHGPTTSTAD